MSKSPISEEDYARVEDYLSGRMQAEERVHFEAEMGENPSLMAAMEDYREIIAALQAGDGERMMREMLARWAGEVPDTAEKEDESLASENAPLISEHEPDVSEVQSSAPKSSGQRRKSMSPRWMIALPIAAGVALAVWVGVQYLSEPQPYVSRFEKYFHIDPRAPYNLGPGDHHEGQLAMGAYQHEDFPTADSLFRLARAQAPEDDTLRYFHAITKLAMGKEFEATVEFQQLCNGPSTFRDMARWYRALALMKMGDDDAAVTDLQVIRQEPGHPMQQQAAELLEEILRQ